MLLLASSRAKASVATCSASCGKSARRPSGCLPLARRPPAVRQASSESPWRRRAKAGLWPPAARSAAVAAASHSCYGWSLRRTFSSGSGPGGHRRLAQAARHRKNSLRITAWYKAPSRARLAGGKLSELHDVVEVDELLLDDLARRSLGRGLHALASAFACHANFRGRSGCFLAQISLTALPLSLRDISVCQLGVFPASVIEVT